jgi:hypothetical protein
MARFRSLWLAALLSLLALSAWMLSRSGGLSESNSLQPAVSGAERQAERSSTELPDASVTRRAALADQSAEAAEEERDSSESSAAPRVDVTVFGQVKDGHRVPIANAELELVQLVNDLPHGPTIYLRSSPDGTFQTVIPIDHWEPGWRGTELEMKAWSPGFQLDINEKRIRPDSRRVEFEMTLWPGSVVSGRVVDAQSDPVAEAEVILVLDGSAENSEETRGDGTYSINFEHAGDYVLHAREEPAGVSSPLPVKLQTDRQNMVPDLVLAEGPGEIAGVLVDTFGEPVPAHSLRAQSESYLASRGVSIDNHELPSGWSSSDTVGLEESGFVRSEVVTGSDGSFRFTGLSQGKFAVSSWHGDRKVWVARTGQTNLRLVRDVYTLHVRVQDEEDPERPMPGSVFLQRSGGTQSYVRLQDSEARIPVRPRESYLVSYMTPTPPWYVTGEVGGLSSGTPPPMGLVQRRISIDLGDPNPSLLMLVRSQAAGTLEVCCQLPKGLAETWLAGKIMYGQESSAWRSFRMRSSSIERTQLAAGQYVLVLEDDLNGQVSGWIRDFAVAPPARSAFPSNWSTAIPTRSRHMVKVLPGETTGVTLELVEAGAVLIILGSEGESLPSLTTSVLTDPQGGSRSDTARSYFISWEEGRPVKGHLLRWSLGAGEYSWRASARDYRDLALEFTVSPGDLTVARGTWRE